MAMTTSGRSPEAIRQTWAYRAALWCGRLCYAQAVVAVVLGFVTHSGRVFALACLVILPLVVAFFGLMLLSGAMFARGGDSSSYYHNLSIDPEISQYLFRDMWWLPRR
jgi:hypothetical protein